MVAFCQLCYYRNNDDDINIACSFHADFYWTALKASYAMVCVVYPMIISQKLSKIGQ